MLGSAPLPVCERTNVCLLIAVTVWRTVNALPVLVRSFSTLPASSWWTVSTVCPPPVLACQLVCLLSLSVSLDSSFLLCLAIPVMTLHILLAFFLFTFYQGNSSQLFAQFSYLKMIWQLSWCYCKLKYNCWLDLQVRCWETQSASGAFFCFFPVPLPGKSTVKFYFRTLTFCANCVHELLGKAPLAQNKAEVCKRKIFSH